MAKSDHYDLTAAEQAVQARVGELHDVDFTAMAAVANVYRVASAVRNHMERHVLADDELSWTGFTMLFVLWVWGEQESRHLAAECGVSKATLTGVMSTLGERGLVGRRAHPTDRRLVLVELTDTGHKLIRELFPRFNEQEAFVTRRLDDPARRTLAHALREMLRALDG
jgi:MarR family transcriptional regulator, organic hydroperoxide resistance regulator